MAQNTVEKYPNMTENRGEKYERLYDEEMEENGNANGNCHLQNCGKFTRKKKFTAASATQNASEGSRQRGEGSEGKEGGLRTI